MKEKLDMKWRLNKKEKEREIKKNVGIGRIIILIKKYSKNQKKKYRVSDKVEVIYLYIGKGKNSRYKKCF